MRTHVCLSVVGSDNRNGRSFGQKMERLVSFVAERVGLPSLARRAHKFVLLQVSPVCQSVYIYTCVALRRCRMSVCIYSVCVCVCVCLYVCRSVCRYISMFVCVYIRVRIQYIRCACCMCCLYLYVCVHTYRTFLLW